MFPLQFIDKVWTFRDPAAAGSRRQSEVPQIQFVLIMGALMGFLAHFAPFFALLRLSGVERQFFAVGRPR